ncbi:FMN-binding protein [Prevotella falsenii]|uniref:FMN-binding protein n=1 Tax=Prevotella falsenii TaxID=515414 RepID=UPI0004682D22|nr:FMN-binding protein [Prevotella falsenii]
MKKQILAFAVVALTTAGLAFAAVGQDNVMRKQEDGTYVVNTTTLATNVRGYKGATPLEVYIKKNKVVALKNRETPKYFELVTSNMLPKFDGKSISKVGSVDGVSGATFSSRAVKANVEAAVKYYKAHK